MTYVGRGVASSCNTLTCPLPHVETRTHGNAKLSQLEGKMAETTATRKKKTIVFFHPDLGIGGAERLVVDAAVGLQNRGHKVVIFTSHCDPKHCFDEARDGTYVTPASSPNKLPSDPVADSSSKRDPRSSRARQHHFPALHPLQAQHPVRHRAATTPPRADPPQRRARLPAARCLLRRPAQRRAAPPTIPPADGAHPVLLPLSRSPSRPGPGQVAEEALPPAL